jgi:hypothetical protein
MKGGFGDNEIELPIMGPRRQLIEQLKRIGQAYSDCGGRHGGEQAVIMAATPAEASPRETEGQTGNAYQRMMEIAQIRNFFALRFKYTV